MVNNFCLRGIPIFVCRCRFVVVVVLSWIVVVSKFCCYGLWSFLPCWQARRHGGAFQGRSLPNDCLCPPNENCAPKRGLCPKEINRLWATGVQIEALDFHNSAYRPTIRVQELFFRNFCGLTPDFMKFRVDFGTKNFFFLWSSPFSFDPHSRIHINKTLVPPKIYLCPPSHAVLAPGLHVGHARVTIFKSITIK